MYLANSFCHLFYFIAIVPIPNLREKYFFHKDSINTDFFVTDLPVVTIPFNTYEVTVGGYIIIQCIVSSDSAVTAVKWTKTLNRQTEIILTHGNFRYTGGTIDSPSLGITQATLADEGSYTCSATNFVGTTSSQQTYLYISGSMLCIINK
jgi:hypothetical protein